MTRYEVTYGPEFLAAAQAAYPDQRNTRYSGPTFHDFMRVPVRSAKFAFATNWDKLPSEMGGAVRLVILGPHWTFGPIVFYAALVSRRTGPVIEITAFEEDRDYWDTFDDPDD